MTNEPPVDGFSIFQKQLQETKMVDEEARKQKIGIEDSLKLDPFIDHLYTDGEFEKLIFFEMRRNNEILTEIRNLLSGGPHNNENPGSPSRTIVPPDMEESLKNVVLTASNELTAYEQLIEDREQPIKQEPVDPKTGIHQVESDGLSEAEKATLASNVPSAEETKKNLIEMRRRTSRTRK